MQIYINKNGQQLGAFEENVVIQMLQNGQLSPDDLGIRQGDSNWQPLRILFPTQVKTVNLPSPNTSPIQTEPTKSGGSKLWLFALLGLGGLLLVGIIGIAGTFFYLKSKPAPVAAPNSNQSANSNSSTNSNVAKTTPTPSTKPGEERFKAMKMKAEELAQMSPLLKLDPNAIIKGKVAVVVKDNREAETKGFNAYYNDYALMNRDVFGLSKQRLATTPEEIDTLIQVLCSKGKQMGKYEGNINGYANNCKVSIIDYRNPAILAQANFTNDQPEKTISSVYESSGEYVFPSPDDQIGGFVAQFQLEKLPNLEQLPFNSEDGKYGKYTPFKEMASEFSRVALTDNISPTPTLKGKVAIVEQKPDGETDLQGFDVYGKEFQSYDLDKYGLTKDKLAENAGEIETVVRIICKRGAKLKTVKQTAVYSNQCEVSIVDYKASTVIARKSFENKEIFGDVDTDIYKLEYIVLPPSSEMESYVKGLPKS